MHRSVIGFFLGFLFIQTTVFSQCPTADFTIPDTVCLNEPFKFINNSTSGFEYHWDLCEDQLLYSAANTELSNSTTFLSAYTFDLINSGNKNYGMVLRNAGLLYRIELNDSLTILNSITVYPDERSNFNTPRDVKLDSSNGNWIGLATNSNGSLNLTRIIFGSSIENNPTYDHIDGITPILNTNGLEIVNDANHFFALAGKDITNEIYVLDFQDDLMNTPAVSSFSVPDATGIQGISMIKDCNTWVALATSLSNNKLFKLTFNNGLDNTPDISEIIVNDASFLNPAKVKIVVENGHFYAFIQSDAGSLFRLAFGSSMANDPEITAIPALTSNGYAVNLAIAFDQWHLFVVDYINSTKGLFHMSFENTCPLAQHDFTDFEPQNVSISTPGTYPVSLTVTDSNGNSTNLTKDLVVTGNEAPDISFITNGNACVDNISEFTGISPDQISSWSWDFGDSSTSSEQNPIHQYSAPGKYPVRLEVVSSMGCGNYFIDSVAIYDPPVADFDLPVSNLCTDNELTFSNTSTGINADSIKFLWYFNDETTSDEIDGLYNFTEPGQKSVTLVADITGCMDTLTRQISISAGPYVDFTWTSNCWDKESGHSTPQFINLSDTTNVLYNWNFGDGSPESTMQSPSHIYAFTDTLGVHLKVESTLNGCTSDASDTIYISDFPQSSFNISEYPVSNVPVSFYGNDLTNVQDSIISWQWQFDSLGYNENQVSEATFPSTGTYNITLTTNTEQGCQFDTTQQILINAPLCPSPDFSIPDSVCLNEQIPFINNSANGMYYQWDLCPDQLSTEKESNALYLNNDAFRAGYSLDLINNDSIHSGFTIRNAGLLYKLNFNDSLNAVTDITPLPDQNSFFNSPRDLKVLFSKNNWIGLATNSGSLNLTRINFGNSLENNPTYDNIIDITSIPNTNGLELINDSGIFFAFAGKEETNEIYVLDFQDDLLNTPLVTNFTISGATGVQGISLIKDCNTWVGLVTSQSSNKLYKLTFNDGLTVAPDLTEIIVNDTSFTSPAKVKLVVENGHFYGFIQLDAGKLFRLSFGSSMTNDPEISTIPAITPNGFALNLANYLGHWHLFVVDYVNSTKGLFHLSFENSCPLSQHDFSDFEPQNVSISTPGIYPVSLTVTDTNGNSANLTKELVVSVNEAPGISLTTNGNTCVDNISEFTGISPDSVSFWSWDFGDTSSSSQQSSSHQYSEPGNYPVTLTVQAGNSCSNFRRDTVRIYTPPSPDFSIADTLLCSNNELSLQNSSIYSSPDSITTFNWYIENDSLLNIKDASYAFPSGGQKSITLSVTIPGCSIDTTKSFDIMEGPVSYFIVQNICNSETAVFNNLSTGNIVDYHWEFGDGNTSDEQAPTNIYPGSGDYPVDLEVKNDAGCVNIHSDTITVHSLPEPDFSNALACTNSGVAFYDNSTVEKANITGWDWNYISLNNPSLTGSSTVRNPEFNFPEPGDYNLRLLVSSNFGCSDSLVKTISILPSPVAGFSFNETCLGDTTYFSDTSIPGPSQNINSWIWNIDDHSYTEANPDYIFNGSGSYEVSLLVRADNLCESQITKTITIDPLPEAAFTTKDQCLNQTVRFISQATSQSDPIEDYIWNVPGINTPEGMEISILADTAGIYPVTHTVVTEKGCRNSVLNNIEIYAPPVAGFDFSPKYGAIPFMVSFENTSSNAGTYYWDFGTNEGSSNESDPNYTYMETGEFQPILIAVNQFGCSDTISSIINVVDPELNIQLSKVEETLLNGVKRYVLTIVNKGSVIVDNMDIQINVNGEYTLTEPFDDILYAGQTIHYPLKFELVYLENQIPEFICFKLVPAITGYEDLDSTDNQECTSRDNQYLIRELYPNPASDIINLGIVLPEKDDITLRLISNEGKLLWDRRITATKAGLNMIHIDLKASRQGMYLLNIIYKDFRETRRIAVIK